MTEVSADQIQYEVMQERHVSEVRALMLRSFYTEEPINQFAGLEGAQVGGFLHQFLPMCVEEGVSLVALSQRRVVGLRLATLHTRGQDAPPDPFGTSGIPQKVAIVRFLTDLNDGIDFHDIFQAETVLRFKMLNVDAAFGRRGIARELVVRTMELARSKGARCVVAEATGKFSQRLYEKMEFKVFREFFYDDYKIDGKIVFHRNGSIHDSCQLLAKEL